MRVALELRRAHAQERAALRLLLGDARGLDRARGVPQLRGDPFLDRRVHRALARCDGVRARRDARAAASFAARRSRVAGQRHDAIAATAVVRSNARCLPTVANARRAHAATRPRCLHCRNAAAAVRHCRRARARAKPSTRDRSSRRLRPRRVGAPSRRARRAASPPNRRSPTGPTRGGVVRASAARPRAELRCRAAGGSPCPAGNQWWGGSILSRRRRAENCLRLVQRGRRRDASSFGSRSRQNQK